jgi:CubicO group peptidase (beta-lactamase class C family)
VTSGFGSEPWDFPGGFKFGTVRDAHVPSILERVRREHDLPALAAVSTTSTGMVELAAVGVRAVGFRDRVTTNDQWHLGSITKTMTATVAARLVERGCITWDTTIVQAVPELAGAMRKEYRKVTLDQLLRHESGLPREVPMESHDSATAQGLLRKGMPVWFLHDDDAKRSPTENRLKWAAAVLALPPVGPKGKSEYSNAGFMIAGLMLEKASGKSFETLFEQELLAPLGMTSTGFGPPGVPGERDQPWGHWSSGDSTRVIWHALDPSDRFADNPPSLNPAGVVHASLQDIARFACAHLRGELGTAGLLPVKSFRRLHTPEADAWAMDWMVSTRDWAKGRWLYHSGSNGRWFACLTLAPDVDFAVFAACNAAEENGERACDQAAWALVQRYLATRTLNKGLTILAADQCPYVAKSVERIADASRTLGLVPKVVRVGSAKASRELPTPYGDHGLAQATFIGFLEHFSSRRVGSQSTASGSVTEVR